MPDNDLVFSLQPAVNGDLLFGEESPPAVATLSASFPAFSAQLYGFPPVSADLTCVFPAFSVVAEAIYSSNTQRPVVGKTASSFDTANGAKTGALEGFQRPTRTSSVGKSVSHNGNPCIGVNVLKLIGTLHTNPVFGTGNWANARSVPTSEVPIRSASADGGMRPDVVSTFSEAARRVLRRLSRHSVGVSARRKNESKYGRAKPAGLVLVWKNGRAQLRHIGALTEWDSAYKPLPGVWVPTDNPPPPESQCYPKAGRSNLVFKEAGGNSNLVFVCDNWTPPPTPEGQVIIPVRRAYIVVNDIQVVRIADSVNIPTTSLSINFDCDSWLPAFSANVPEAYRDLIMPGSAPVNISVTVNGSEFHFAVEKVQRTRQFGNAVVAISGRGVACELGSPFAVAQQHTNAVDRTAQQLIDDALTYTGYSQAWGITDWLVPSNSFSMFGAPVDVALAVAEASGSVLQAGRSTKTLRMMPRYKYAPWDWGSATPDIVIPAAVTQTETVEWTENPGYNAVYVSGEQNGVLGHVKRIGTAGDVVAPMFTNSLITHADAARQKGTAILSNTGRKSILHISMPVLQSTGVIDICKFIEFSDGTNTRRGIVRANTVNVNWPSVRQNLIVEATV